MDSNIIYIALADDHVLLRNGLKELIHTFGRYKVIIEADNGQDLLDQLERSKIIPDICVLDVSMPVLNGYETQVQLRKNWPSIKTLVLSQFSNEFTIIALLKEGASGYLLKSAGPKEFKKALESIINNDYYHPELSGGKFQQYVYAIGKSLPEISKNELMFLSLCCSELTYKDMGDKIGVSARTIDGYRDNLFNKLNIKSRSGLVMYALKSGIVPLIDPLGTIDDDNQKERDSSDNA